ncbi:hypothetical protein RYX36_022635 [Vicia faba]
MNCSYVKDYEFVAIFDADFQPSPDFLKRTVPHFKCQCEIPECYEAYRKQQHRWHSGPMQLFRLCLPDIIRSKLGSAYEWIVTKKSGPSLEGDLVSLIEKEQKHLQKTVSVYDLEEMKEI